MNLHPVMMRCPQSDQAVPAHQRFLDEPHAGGRVERSGPFGDNSGSACLPRAFAGMTARRVGSPQENRP